MLATHPIYLSPSRERRLGISGGGFLPARERWQRGVFSGINTEQWSSNAHMMVYELYQCDGASKYCLTDLNTAMSSKDDAVLYRPQYEFTRIEKILLATLLNTPLAKILTPPPFAVASPLPTQNVAWVHTPPPLPWNVMFDVVDHIPIDSLNKPADQPTRRPFGDSY